ncbi:M20 metallopeptidase family protein [Jatrophihabitans fulvus]
MTAGSIAEGIGSIDAALADELPAAVALRHRLHASPDPSGDEGPTLARVIEALGPSGEVRSVAGTGALVGRTGAVVLRAELDGLPVVEQTGVDWASDRPVMHACGHDVHLAAAVAAYRAITSVDPGAPVAVLFQPREETPPSGAADVVASGVLDVADVRAVVAAHVQPQLAAGVVNVTAGVVNASVDEFEVVVRGRGGHAGYPHTVRDPVVAASAVVLALQQIAARRVDPVRGAVCTVGRIAGGTAGNVVPDEVSLLGTLRVMAAGDRDELLAVLREIAEATARAHGCSAEVTVRSGEPAVDNHAGLARAAAVRLRAAGVPTDTTWRSFGSDDFSHFNAVRPSLMAFVGVDGGAGLHEPRFLPPDDTVGLVARTLVAEYLAALDVPAG